VCGAQFLETLSEPLAHARNNRSSASRGKTGQLIDLISNIRVGDEESRSKDVLGRVYEYF
jgi:type I restriction-modification system DNA methylase subunit